MNAHYIRTPIGHEQLKPETGKFRPLNSENRRKPAQTENDFSKGGYVNRLSRRERPVSLTVKNQLSQMIPAEKH